VANATNLRSMICDCLSSNLDISCWNVANATDLTGMFWVVCFERWNTGLEGDSQTRSGHSLSWSRRSGRISLTCN
jgi:hypothetical protein